MKSTLQHLSGSRRGHSDVVEKERFTIGTAPDCDLHFSAAVDSRVSDYQAEISYENCEYYLRDLQSVSGTFVNNVQVTEIIIRDGDLIEFGLGGPKVRFLVRQDDHLACKPFREILSDSRALAVERPRNLTVTATVFARALVEGLIREASPRAKLIAAIVSRSGVKRPLPPICGPNLKWRKADWKRS